MSEKQNQELIVTSELSDSQNNGKLNKLQKVSDELNFNIRNIDNMSEQVVSTLSKAEVKIQKCVDNLVKTTNEINAESRILSMIPEKMQSRINEIAPQIASEVEKIHSEKVEAINKQFEKLQEIIEISITNHQQNLLKMTDDCLDKMSSSTEQFAANLEQEFKQFASQLVRDAEAMSFNNRTKLFKGLALIVMFSGMVSSITSYVVTNKFPRFVWLEAMNDVTIHNSKVDVYSKISPSVGQKKNESKKN